MQNELVSDTSKYIAAYTANFDIIRPDIIENFSIHRLLFYYLLNSLKNISSQKNQLQFHQSTKH